LKNKFERFFQKLSNAPLTENELITIKKKINSVPKFIKFLEIKYEEISNIIETLEKY
jgi:hypothetical protein